MRCRARYSLSEESIMANVRMRKIDGEIRRCISEIISTRLKNPEITEMVSIMRVETSGDLKHAKVYVSVFSKNAERAGSTFRALSAAAPAVRRELSQMTKLRTVPELHFINDDSLEYSIRISKLIDEVLPVKDADLQKGE